MEEDDTQIYDSNEAWLESIQIKKHDFSDSDLYKLASGDIALMETEFAKYLECEDRDYFRFDTRELAESTTEEAQRMGKEYLSDRIQNDINDIDFEPKEGIGYNEADKIFTAMTTGDEASDTQDDITKLLKAAPRAWYALDESHRNSSDIQRIALAGMPGIYEHCNEDICSDMKLSRTVFRQEPHHIAYASEEIRNDTATVIVCVKADPAAIHNAGPIPYEIYKNAGYGDKGLAALERALELEKLNERLHSTIPKKPTQTRQLKI